jgi:hypothetical protein
MVDTSNDKATEAAAAAATSKGDAATDAPPSYTPRPVTQTNPPPSSSSSRSPPPVALPSDRIYTPGPSFSQDLSKVGEQPANVVCPRCHYGVQTQTRTRVGTHAG